MLSSLHVSEDLGSSLESVQRLSESDQRLFRNLLEFTEQKEFDKSTRSLLVRSVAKRMIFSERPVLVMTPTGFNRLCRAVDHHHRTGGAREDEGEFSNLSDEKGADLPK